MKVHRSAILLGVAIAGLVLGQQGCASPDVQSSGPIEFTLPSAGASTSFAESTPSPRATPLAHASPAGETKPGGPTRAEDSDGILAGKRRIVIRPIPGTESIVAVDGKGRLNVTDGESASGLFVLTPSGDRYLIKTAQAGADGEPSCMEVKSKGSESLTVVASACDAGRAAQLFTIAKAQGKVSAGRPTYSIANGDAFLQDFGDGLIAEELGDAPLKTTYAFVDNGPSTLPDLD